MQKSGLYRVLQVYLALVAVFHLATGIGVNCGQKIIEMIAAGYGASVDFTPQFLAILHPLGAFMFVLGILAAVAAVEPVRYRAIGYAFGLLFLIRAAQRVMFKDEILSAFNISQERNMGNILLFSAMGLSLVLLVWIVDRGAKSQAA